MNKKPNTIDRKGAVYEIYHTRNPVIRWLARRWTACLREALHSIQAAGLKGLDAGCGEGHMLHDLIQTGSARDLIGFDLDAERVAEARRAFPGLKFEVADIYHLPFAPQTFDYVVAAEILEHLPDSEAALKALRRVTKSGGYALFSVPYEPYFHWGNYLRGRHRDRGGRTPAHLHFWTRREFQQLVSSFGDIEVQYRWAAFPWHVVLLKWNP